MYLGEPANLSAEQKKEVLLLLERRIEVRAKCRQVRNSVESAMYEPVVIMQFPDAAPHPCPRPAKRGEGDHLLKSTMAFTTPSDGQRKISVYPCLWMIAR